MVLSSRITIIINIIQTIEYIGQEKIRELDIEVNQYPLILRYTIPQLAGTIFPISNGWFIYIPSILSKKISLLEEINHQLGKPFNFVIGDNDDINDMLM